MAAAAASLVPSSSRPPRAGSWSYSGCYGDTSAHLFTSVMSDTLNADVVLYCQTWGVAKGYNMVGILGTSTACYGCLNCLNGPSNFAASGCASNSGVSPSGFPVGATGVMAVYSWSPQLAAAGNGPNGLSTSSFVFSAAYDIATGAAQVCAGRAVSQTIQSIGSVAALAPAVSAVSMSAVAPWVFAGCFTDAAFRAIPASQIITLTANNGGSLDLVGQCLAMAQSRGFNTVGVEVGSQCFFCNGCAYWSMGFSSSCTNSNASISSIGSVGGPWGLSVYTLPAAGSWSYKGCYTDANQHVMMPYLYLTGVSDVGTACQAWGASVGFNFVGIEANTFCFGCSNCNYAALGSSTNCALNTALSPSNQMLGGSWSLAVYSFTAAASGVL